MQHTIYCNEVLFKKRIDVEARRKHWEKKIEYLIATNTNKVPNKVLNIKTQGYQDLKILSIIQ